MVGAPFDPAHAVRFDLGNGSVRAGGDERVVLLPASALEALAAGAPRETARVLGRAIGRAVGERVRAGLGSFDAARGASVEAFVGRLAGELALMGYGVASLERWGRALVLVVERAPVGDALLADVLEAALETATGRVARCTSLVADTGSVRLLVSSERTHERVLAWLAQGVSWGDAL